MYWVTVTTTRLRSETFFYITVGSRCHQQCLGQPSRVRSTGLGSRETERLSQAYQSGGEKCSCKEKRFV